MRVELPVVRINPDHRVGSYLKPSVIIKAVTPVDRILRSSKPVVNASARNTFSNCAGSRHPSTGNNDANVVIAAYGTQLTLHNVATMPGKKVKVKKKFIDHVMDEAIIPAAIHKKDVTVADVIDVTIRGPGLIGGKLNIYDRCDEPRDIPRGPSPPPSECLSEDYIDRTSLEKPFGFSKPALRRTAWDKSSDGKEALSTVTSFVDFKEMERKSTAEPSDRSKPNLVIPRKSSSNTGIDDSSNTANSFDCILQYHLASRYGSQSNSKLREVWNARNKDQVSLRVNFTPDKLARPRSAYPSLREESLEKTPTSDKKERGYHSNARRPPAKKRAKSRRPRSASVNKLQRNTCQHNQSIRSENDGYDYLQTNSLIRQNHRPTTSIVYLKSERHAIPSITPCVRKARVSHKTDVCSRPRNCSEPKITNLHRKDDSRDGRLLDFSVCVSRLYKSPSDIVTSLSPEISKEASSVVKEVTTQDIYCNDAASNSPTETHEQNDKKDTAEHFAGPDASSTTGKEESCVECAASTKDACSRPASGDHIHESECTESNSGVRIRPLSTHHVTKFNGWSMNDSDDIRRKNTMIKRWLKNLAQSKSENQE